jgi:hypothetical protein
MELARWNLLQGSGMETEIDAAHGGFDASRIAYIAQIEPQLRIIIALAHIVLLLLVATEDANLAQVRSQEAFEDSIAKGTRPARDQKNSIAEHSLSKGCQVAMPPIE